MKQDVYFACPAQREAEVIDDICPAVDRPRSARKLDLIREITQVRRIRSRRSIRVFRQHRIRPWQSIRALVQGRHLRHVGDADVHAHVGVQSAVAHPHRQLVAGRARLVVLPGTDVEQLPGRRLHLEPARFVPRLDAVAQRVAVRVRRRHHTERYPVRAAVRVLRQLEGVSRERERRHLRHVGDADVHAHVGVQSAVAHPHRQLVAGRARLVVLPGTDVEQLPGRRLHLEPARFVPRLDAVAQRVAVRVRRRHHTERYPVRAAVRVLHERERVSLRGERRRPLHRLLLRLRCLPLGLQPLHLGGVGCGNSVAKYVAVIARFHGLHTRVVRSGEQRLRDRFVARAGLGAAVQHVAPGVLQIQLGIGVQLAKAQSYLLRLRQRETVVVDPVRVAVEFVPRKARADECRDVAEIAGARTRIVRVRSWRRSRRGDVGHLELVGAPADGKGARRDMVGAAPCRRERHLAVPTHAAVVVGRVRDAVSLSVVYAPQIGVAQRPVTRRASLQIDPVDVTGQQLDREPVSVA